MGEWLLCSQPWLPCCIKCGAAALIVLHKPYLASIGCAMLMRHNQFKAAVQGCLIPARVNYGCAQVYSDGHAARWVTNVCQACF